jgi:hypothetical protein
MRKHIERKHPGSEIPNNLQTARDNNSKYGKYLCPHCKITSNRKYNMKTHIERKHPGSEIPNNLQTARDNYNNNGYIHRGLPNLDLYLRAKHKHSVPFYDNSFLNNLSDDNILQIFSTPKKNKNSNSIIWEILQYIHLIENLPNRYLLPEKDFPMYNPRLNLNFFNSYKNYPLASAVDQISWNKEILFRIQRCNNCNIAVPVICFGFDNINPIIDHRCNNIYRSQKQNSALSYLIVKEFLTKSIISFIDKEKDSKIYLKCMIISSDIYTKLVVEKKPFFHNDKENGDIPPWMVTYIMQEEIIDLGVIDDGNWAHRLTNNNKKSIEITKSELMEFINYGDSTFGLFRFHKDNIPVYFFSYLQIERIENT